MNQIKNKLSKLIMPSLLFATIATSSVILASKNDLQKITTKANLTDSSTSSTTNDKLINEGTISQNFKNYNTQASTTSEDTYLNFNTQMTYVQFGDFISNNLNNVTTSIPTLTYNTNVDLQNLLSQAITEGMQSVWSSSNWSSSQPNGFKSQILWASRAEQGKVSLETGIRTFAASENAKNAIAYGGAPAIKFNAGNKYVGSGERFFKGFTGFDTAPYKALSTYNGAYHNGSGNQQGSSPYYEKGLNVIGGTIKDNSLFGTSLKNNNSRVVNFFSTKNNSDGEVSSSNYVTTANNSWLNDKGVTYPFQTDTSTGWYNNTSMTTTNLPTWSSSFVDLYLKNIQTTTNVASFGTQAALETFNYNFGQTQAQVLNADNISAYYRMYVNTHQEQSRSSKVIEGNSLQTWYSQNLVDSNYANRVMEGSTTYLGETDVTDTIQNINYDMSKLIVLDTTYTSNYYNSTSGDPWTKATPVTKFTWNLNLFNALYEAKEIADLVSSLSTSSTLSSNDKKTLQEKIYPALLEGKCDLATLKKFVNDSKNSAYGATFTPLRTEADFWNVINDNSWNLPTTTNASNYANTIISWGDAYSVILPKIFKNDIYANVTATGSTQDQAIKIYDGATCTWQLIQTINNNQQLKTFNNNVTMSFNDFWMTKPGTTTQIQNTKGLSLTNIYNTTKLNTTLSSNKKVELNTATATNSLNISFAYNPSLADNTKVVKAGYVDTQRALVALTGNPIYTSDLFDDPDKYRSKFYEETQAQLQVPQAILDSLDTKNQVAFDKTTSFFIPRKSEVTKFLSPEVLASSQASDLLKFVELSDNYNDLRAYNDSSEATLQARETARKALDNLGYYYLKVYSSIPINYYSTKDSYEELQKDKTFVEIGKDGNWYGYYIKYAATKLPLNISDLSKYVTISKTTNSTSVNSEINELSLAEEVKNKLATLSIEIQATNDKLEALTTTNKTLSTEITNLNTQVDKLLKDLVNNNPDLANASSQIDAKYQTQIDTTIKAIEKKKNDFDKNQNYKGGGFVQNIHKELDYKSELSSLVATYETKLNELNLLFTNSGPVLKVQNEIKTLTASTVTKVNNLTNEFNTLSNTLTSLNAENATLLAQLNKIEKLTYTTTTTNTTSVKLNWNLSAISLASKNTDTKSFNNVLSQNKLSDYFYVTKAQFATELNKLIKIQTGVDANLTATNLLFNADGIVEGNNTYSYDWSTSDLNNTLTSLVQKIEIKEVTETVHEVTVNNPKLKESDVKAYDSNISTLSSVDANTLLSNIRSYKATLQTNQTSIASSITKLATESESLTKNAENINQYNNSASLYPDYLATEKALQAVKDQLTNYKPTVFTGTKLNVGLIAGMATGIGIFIILFIGLIVYAKSRHQAKTKDPNKVDTEAIEDFTNQINLSKSKGKKF